MIKLYCHSLQEQRKLLKNKKKLHRKVNKNSSLAELKKSSDVTGA
jgi:hypothetical protein